MPLDSGDHLSRKLTSKPPPPPPEQSENLPCPRCDSTNTKFCYYNNYNFSQPRHFCKGCRRYWTRGGTLRDIPVGGGSRKAAKRSRTSAASAQMQTTGGFVSPPLHAAPVLVPSVQFGGEGKAAGGGSDPLGGAAVCGSFTSLLNGHAHGHGHNGNCGAGSGGFLGFGFGFDDVAFGISRASVWPFSGMVDGASGVATAGGPAPSVPATWQFEGMDGGNGFVGGGDCFALPELAISTPGIGSALK